MAPSHEFARDSYRPRYDGANPIPETSHPVRGQRLNEDTFFDISPLWISPAIAELRIRRDRRDINELTPREICDLVDDLQERHEQASARYKREGTVKIKTEPTESARIEVRSRAVPSFPGKGCVMCGHFSNGRRLCQPCYEERVECHKCGHLGHYSYQCTSLGLKEKLQRKDKELSDIRKALEDAKAKNRAIEEELQRQRAEDVKIKVEVIEDEHVQLDIPQAPHQESVVDLDVRAARLVAAEERRHHRDIVKAEESRAHMSKRPLENEITPTQPRKKARISADDVSKADSFWEGWGLTVTKEIRKPLVKLDPYEVPEVPGEIDTKPNIELRKCTPRVVGSKERCSCIDARKKLFKGYWEAQEAEFAKVAAFKDVIPSADLGVLFHSEATETVWTAYSERYLNFFAHNLLDDSNLSVSPFQDWTAGTVRFRPFESASTGSSSSVTADVELIGGPPLSLELQRPQYAANVAAQASHASCAKSQHRTIPAEIKVLDSEHLTMEIPAGAFLGASHESISFLLSLAEYKSSQLTKSSMPASSKPSTCSIPEEVHDTPDSRPVQPAETSRLVGPIWSRFIELRTVKRCECLAVELLARSYRGRSIHPTKLAGYRDIVSLDLLDLLSRNQSQDGIASTGLRRRPRLAITQQTWSIFEDGADPILTLRTEDIRAFQSGYKCDGVTYRGWGAAEDQRRTEVRLIIFSPGFLQLEFTVRASLFGGTGNCSIKCYASDTEEQPSLGARYERACILENVFCREMKRAKDFHQNLVNQNNRARIEDIRGHWELHSLPFLKHYYQTGRFTHTSSFGIMNSNCWTAGSLIIRSTSRGDWGSSEFDIGATLRLGDTFAGAYLHEWWFGLDQPNRASLKSKYREVFDLREGRSTGWDIKVSFFGPEVVRLMVPGAALGSGIEWIPFLGKKIVDLPDGM